MITKFQKIVFLIIGAICICTMLSAQTTSISAYYQYSIKVPGPNSYYPVGFGSTISKSIYKKLVVSAGIDYSYRSDENQNHITPPIYRTQELYKESIYSLYSGVSYPIMDRKIKIILGSDLVISYFHSSLDFSRYLVSNDLLDLHFKNSDESFEFGFKGKIIFEYSLSDRLAIFAQSGITHYPSSYIKNLFINSTGIKLSF